MKLSVVPTHRGFLRAEFNDLYGARCSIQESALTTPAAIWLGAEERRMHLSQEQVAALLPYLRHFAMFGRLADERTVWEA